VGRSACAAALAAALIAPAAASADDQSIYNAFHSSHQRFVKLRRDFQRGERRWENSQYTRPGSAYLACRRTSRLAKRVNKRMAQKETSSAVGAKARNRAMSSISARRGWSDAERLAIRAFMRFDGYNYIRLKRKAKRQIARAQHYEKLARKLFKQAGVNQNP
jgi:hypothetical protein